MTYNDIVNKNSIFMETFKTFQWKQ
jgi:hypothetical protein